LLYGLLLATSISYLNRSLYFKSIVDETTIKNGGQNLWISDKQQGRTRTEKED